jgi:ABC-type Zn2+ transport system substrate-binding protein/surface adhesin
MIALTPQANCKIQQVDVEQTGDAEHMNEHNHAHEAHTNNDAQQNDEHQHEDEHEHEHEHGSVNIQYQFTCQDMMQLTELSTDWFKHFSHTNEIDANLLMDKKQFATELTAENPRINF